MISEEIVPAKLITELIESLRILLVMDLRIYQIAGLRKGSNGVG